MKKFLSGMIILTMVIMLFTAVGYADGGGNSSYTETEVSDLGDFYSLKTFIYGVEIDAKVVFAAYKDDMLFKVDERDYLPQYASFTNPEYFEIFNIDKDVDYVKVFVFADFDSIAPLGNAEFIDFDSATTGRETVKLRCSILGTNYYGTTDITPKVKLLIIENYNSDDDIFENGNQLIIDSGTTDIYDYSGYIADIYIDYKNYNIDESYVSSFILNKKDLKVITSDQYIKTTSHGLYKTVEYYENPSDTNTSSINVDVTAPIYVNGVQSDKTLESALRNFYGKVEFCRYDSYYNVVHITNYKTIVVDSVDEDISTVVSKEDEDITLKYKRGDNTIKATLYGTDGKVMDWADLNEWDTVSYTETNTSVKVIKAYLVDGAVTGKITEMGDDSVVINGNEYGLKDYYDVWIGDEGTFFTDIMGKIVWFRESKKRFDYGYVLNAAVVQDFDYKMQLQMLTGDGETKVYDFAGTVRIDDDSYSGYSIPDAFEAEDFERRLVRYELDINGEISILNTRAKNWTSSSKPNDFTRYGDLVTESVYTKSTGSFTTTLSRVYANENTKIFYVNSDNEKRIVNVSELNDGAVLKNAFFFSPDSNLFIDAVLVFGEIDFGTSSGDDPVVIDYYNPLAVQAYTNYVLDGNGNTVNKIYAYTNSGLNSFLYDGYDILETGTAFRASLSSDMSEITNIEPLVSVVDGKLILSTQIQAFSPYYDADGMQYAFDYISEIHGRRVTLEGGNEIVIPDNTPVYVVDGRISNYKKRVMLADIDYLDYDEENKAFVDADGAVDYYVLFARYNGSRFVDVVLYVSYEID